MALTLLWIALAVIAVVALVAVVRVLGRLMAAARQLQRNVDSLGASVNAELKRLEIDVNDLGDSIDETRRR